jgi:membrane-associated phospholipid phosphatase
MPRLIWSGATSIAIGLLAVASVAAAEPIAQQTTGRRDEPQANKIDWTYSRVSPLEMGITGAFLLGAGAASFLRSREATGTWQGGNNFFDKGASGFTVTSERQQQQIARISDMFLYGMIALPYLDAAYVAGVRRSPDAAMQMALINTQAFALTGLTTTLIKMSAGRNRPCADGTGKCDNGDSFLSGHSSMTFTSAGLMCAHHQALGIYGNKYADGAACVAALGMATATGFMRIAADKHYASDVFAGAAIGLASGYLIPKLLHYGGFGGTPDLSRDTVAKKPNKSVIWSAAPAPTRGGAMLSVTGVFF